MVAISAITASRSAASRAHRAGDGHVADRAVADARLGDLLAVARLEPLRLGEQHPVALEHPAVVGEVDRRQLELLALDVVPDVELGPAREREDAHVLAAADAAVVEVPDLGPLRARIPLPELVAEREDPLLGARALLVAAGAAERRVEAVVLDRLQQHRGLQAVARRPLLLDAARVDRLLHGGDDQLLAERLDQAVAELDHLGEVVAGVDVEDRERQRAGPERLLGEAQQDDRVLAAGEQQHRALQLGRHLADDVDRLRLETVELGDAHAGHLRRGSGRPARRAVVALPAQRRLRDRRRTRAEVVQDRGRSPRGVSAASSS